MLSLYIEVLPHNYITTFITTPFHTKNSVTAITSKPVPSPIRVGLYKLNMIIGLIIKVLADSLSQTDVGQEPMFIYVVPTATAPPSHIHSRYNTSLSSLSFLKKLSIHSNLYRLQLL